MSNECTMSKENLIFDLEKGLESEEAALATYESLVKLMYRDSEKDDRAIVKKIAEDEKRHIKIVEGLIEMVKNNYVEKK